MNRPLLPLATDSWDAAEFAAIDRVVASRQFSMSGEVAAFERDAASFFGTRHALMVNSGSSANLVAVAGLVYHPDALLKPGDEVLVPAVSWSTSYYPVHQLRLKLRFVDIDPGTLNLDLDQLERALTRETRAVLAVNLLGNPVDLPRLAEFCQAHGLILIEDNCESMGATVGGRQAGTFGRCGTFSTFYSHHISTMEGGFVVTDDTRLHNTMISLRAHGWVRGQPDDTHLEISGDPFERMFRFVLPGYNLRPLEMSGAIGQEQLKKLPMIVAERRANADRFAAACGGIVGIRLQQETGESSWFGFSLVLEDALSGRRAELVAMLKEAGIECRPIVAGNFVKNPVVDLLDHSVAGPLPVAEDIDRNGLFIGNHHFPVGEQLAQVGELLCAFSKL
jgi:CDP-6-deoxy-D-xylo-4-hexulose-3-dehydrase